MSALALDRQAIEKKDFPISRRGYEPEAVDAHLFALATEVERLQSELDRTQGAAGAAVPEPTPGVQSLAVAASEQVRMIVEAAESSASAIERSAEEQAARIRADADTEARRVRDEAVQRSEDHVGRVGAATTGMLQRVDAMEQELGALLESLRTGTNRLSADLSLLEGGLGDLHGAPSSTGIAAAPLVSDPEALAPAEGDVPVELPPEWAPESGEPSDGDDRDAGLSGSVVAEPVAGAPSAPAATPPGEGDVEGARLIALNMALNGQSRAETDQYLQENFDLADRATLLDEVYASVEG